MLIYKVFRISEWAEFVAAGRTRGAPVDLSDGYIHFSTAVQLPETLRRHFDGETDLLLAAAETDRLGVALKWEPARGGVDFPHLYRTLERAEVLWSRPLATGGSGAILPSDLE